MENSFSRSSPSCRWLRRRSWRCSCAATTRRRSNGAKWLALFTTSATFVISLFMLFRFDPSNTGFQFVEERPWILGLSATRWASTGSRSCS
jgi:hypothetical protein